MFLTTVNKLSKIVVSNFVNNKKNSWEVMEKLKLRSFKDSQLSSIDFSTW